MSTFVVKHLFRGAPTDECIDFELSKMITEIKSHIKYDELDTYKLTWVMSKYAKSKLNIYNFDPRKVQILGIDVLFDESLDALNRGDLVVELRANRTDDLWIPIMPSLGSLNIPRFNFIREDDMKNICNDIKDVIYNNPATIVFWKDGTKTVVKCSDNEDFDAEKGLALCIIKKMYNNKGNYNNLFRKWVQ